jgi:hypothetical protein
VVPSSPTATHNLDGDVVLEQGLLHDDGDLHVRDDGRFRRVSSAVVELHREMRNDVHTFRGAGRPRDQLLVLWDWTGCRATAACSSKSASESTM